MVEVKFLNKRKIHLYLIILFSIFFVLALISNFSAKNNKIIPKTPQIVNHNDPIVTQAPAQVTGVLIQTFPFGNTLNISWNALGGVAGYIIYRNSSVSPSFSLIANISTYNGSINYYNDIGLVDGMVYWYKVSAYDSIPEYGLNSTPTMGIPVDTVAPTQVTGVEVFVESTGNALNLQWNDLSGSTPDLVGYKIYRSTTTGFTPAPPNFIANTINNFYNDSELVDGVTYYYRISAIDEVPNEGLYSNQASGTPQDLIAPSQVLWSSINPVASGNSILLDWEPISAVDLEGYKLYRSMSFTGPWVHITNVTTPLSVYTDTGLTDGVQYYYKISAYDEVPNYGMNSSVQSCIPQDTQAPGIVTGVTLLNVLTGNTLNISWAPSGASDIVGYRIYRSNITNPGSFNFYTDIMHPTTTYSDTGLIDGLTYFYKIAAFDEVPNYGSNSSGYAGVPTDTTPPAQVTGVQVFIEPTGNSLNLQWNSLSGSTPDLVGYRIYRSITPGFTPGPPTFLGSTVNNFFNDTTLVDGVTYYYRISAIDEVPNEGPFSNQTSGIPLDTTAPGQVVGVIVTNLQTGNTLNITWDICLDSDIMGYRIYRSNISSSGPYSFYTDILHPTSFFLDSSLIDGFTYFYKISAYDEVPNYGDNSSVKSNTPYDTVAPPQVTGVLVFVEPTGNTLNLQWNSLNESTPDLVEYRIYRSTTSGFTPGPLTFLGSTVNNFFNDSALVDGVTYYYRIRAYDEVPNEGPPSSQVSGTPQDLVAPAQVTGVLVFVEPTGNTLNLQWNSLSGSTPDLIGYRIYRSITPGFTPGPPTFLGSTVNNFFNDTGLVDGTTYYYRICAYDEVPNEGPASNQASGSPQDLIAPGQVANVIVTNVGTGNTLNVTWAASSSPDIVGYRIYRSNVSISGPFNFYTDIMHPNTTYLDTGLIDGMTYYYKVASYDEVPNFGANSTVLSGIPMDISPPPQVTGVQVLEVPAGNALNLQWTPLVGDVLGYWVYRNSTLINSTINCYYNDTGLINGIAYYYTIAAYDEVPNYGLNSTIKLGIPVDIIPPAQVTGLTVTNLGTGNSLQLNWTPNSDLDIIGYYIYNRTGSDPYTLLTTVLAPTTSYIHLGLVEGQTYWYKVAAFDEVPNTGLNSSINSGTPTRPENFIIDWYVPPDLEFEINLAKERQCTPSFKFKNMGNATFTSLNFTINLPVGWSAEETIKKFSKLDPDGEITVTFNITVPKSQKKFIESIQINFETIILENGALFTDSIIIIVSGIKTTNFMVWLIVIIGSAVAATSATFYISRKKRRTFEGLKLKATEKSLKSLEHALSIDFPENIMVISVELMERIRGLKGLTDAEQELLIRDVMQLDEEEANRWIDEVEKFLNK